MHKIKDHYGTLGVKSTAPAREILRARNRLLREFHPDFNTGPRNEAKEKTIEILKAADVLMNTEARAAYDRAYNNFFAPAAGARAGSRRASGAKPAPEITVVVCDNCNHRNVNPRHSYCMFCGAGLGEHPKDFSFDDLDPNFFRNAAKGFDTGYASIFSGIADGLSDFLKAIFFIMVLVATVAFCIIYLDQSVAVSLMVGWLLVLAIAVFIMRK
jgi:curved DNA-binding protein CbpA